MPSITFNMDMLIVKIRCIPANRYNYFLWARAVNHTQSAPFASDLNMSLQPHHIYFMSAPYIERSNVLTHLVAPYRGQATRDIGVLNMYSECKSSAEARAPRGCLRPPHSIPRPHISKPAGRFPNLPPPPSSPTHALWTSQNPWGHQNVNWASNLPFHLLLSVMIIKYQCRNNGIENIWIVPQTVSFRY